MKRNKGYTLLEVLVVAILIIVVLGLIGWVKDIVKFVGCDFQEPYKAEIIYGAGLIPPIGAFVGWFVNIEDGPQETPAN